MTSSTELLGLPKDVMECIFLNCCDAKSLAKFWQAIATNKSYSKQCWFSIIRVIEMRVSGLPPSASRDTILPYLSPKHLNLSVNNNNNNNMNNNGNNNNNGWSVVMQTRHLTLLLSCLEYCTSTPHLLWCGHLEFKDPMMPDWSTQHAKVVLQSEECWNLSHLHKWRATFPVGTKLVSQMYNFVPIQPRGILYGVTKEDAATLLDIRYRLERRDQVMTLRFRQDDGFILRIISPEQASRRLEPFSHLSQVKGFETFPDGLLCCWETPYDSSTGEGFAQLEPIQYMINQYRELANTQ